MIKENNYNLKQLNSFRLDSIGKTVYFPESIPELIEVYKNNPDAKILAGGTNVILQPYIDTIICLNKMPKTILHMPFFTPNEIIVHANCSTQKFVQYITELKQSGFEKLWGIPGTIGGAIVMNAGSGGEEISNNLIEVQTLTRKGKIKTYKKRNIKFKRRYSIFQDKTEILISAKFKLSNEPINLELLNQTKKHRLSIPTEPSAGGFFINWHELKPYQDKLIGYTIGDVQVSKSVNIIINKGNALYTDVLSMLVAITKIVPKKLNLEVKFL